MSKYINNTPVIRSYVGNVFITDVTEKKQQQPFVYRTDMCPEYIRGSQNHVLGKSPTHPLGEMKQPIHRRYVILMV